MSEYISEFMQAANIIDKQYPNIPTNNLGLSFGMYKVLQDSLPDVYKQMIVDIEEYTDE